jgi:hypothetical protein
MNLPICLVARKPECCEAVRFDGSPEMAQAVIDWVRESQPDCLPPGHHRPACGLVPSAIFQPLLGAMLMVLAGQWVVKVSAHAFIAYAPESFAAKFEVYP